MKCAEVSKFVYVYLDGEFEPRECAEFEEHVRGCDACRRTLAFERSFHGLVRDRIERPEAPAHLRERVLSAIDREDHADAGLAARFGRLPVTVKAAPALAAAALLALLLWPAGHAGVPTPDGDGVRTSAAGLMTRGAPLPGAADADTPIRDLMTQAAAVHEVALPAEVEGDAVAIERFAASRVPFQARPPFLDAPQLRLVGARQARLGGQPAVLYTYQYKGKRLTVAQFAEADGGARDRARFRRAVFTDRRGPYNIVLVRDSEQGVTNSVVGDVDEGDLLRLVPASFRRK